MESTKIPKPSFKLPRVPTTTKKLATTDDLKHNFQKRVLRRRSKSLTDLKLATVVKPQTLQVSKKPMEKPPLSSLKSGQKRPALSKIDENKPKVAKVKIPDWDYKSRFQELQKKHTVLREEISGFKSELLELTKLKEEVEELRIQNRDFKETLESLNLKEKFLISEKERLLNELSENTKLLNAKEEAYEEIKSQFDSLQTENRENVKQIGRLQEESNDHKLYIKDLEEKNQELQLLVENLKESLEEHEDQRRILHNTVQDLKGNIRVFCRIRPPVTVEEKERHLCEIVCPNEATLEIKRNKPEAVRQEFIFDKVFSPEVQQVEVFEELAHLVQSALDGYHVCVFAYGQTGSGKTYTMQGADNDDGMIPRTIDLIFNKINKLAKADWDYTVSASFLEIYNENIRDLLVPNSTHNYTLRYNEGRGITVTNLQIISIKTAENLKNLMQEANKNRATAATDFNLHSSRSHSVTKIHLEGVNTRSKVKYSGSINLVDLAGSESAKTSTAERLNETKNINKSLSTLGNVMMALHNNDKHIPYRNSKLTFLLQDCLGGNSKTLMFVNIAPFEECFNESINSLRFASTVKDVKTVARKNKVYT